MMKEFFTFERSTLLETSPADAFVFHENPANISRIAPPSLRVISVSAQARAKQGERFTLRVSQFGLPMTWEGEWEIVEPPHRLVDIGIRCPFRYWRHEHRFEAEGSGTRMTDLVTLAPFGGRPVLAAGHVFISLFLKKMFSDRHVATRRFFSNQLRGSG